MGHKAALAAGEMLNAETRKHRNEERAAKTSTAQKKATAARAASPHTPGEGASNYRPTQEANDSERASGGTKNRELTGTKSAAVNEALKRAGVGADD